jgi:phage-related protein
MAYRIDYFNTQVKLAIDAWPTGVRASYVRIAQRMLEHGPNLGMPYTRAMGDGLFELRAKGPEGIGRAFFCALVNKRIVVLHEIIKKTQKTPDKDLEIARRRLKQVKNG